MDRVAELFEAWRSERPDLDIDLMITVGRLLAFADHARAAIGENARKAGLTFGEGDILFSLRRAGPPYERSPTQLAQTLLVPSGTLTGRLDKLERLGLIERVPNPADRRAMSARLTERGIKGTDVAVTNHMKLERKLLAPLSAAERDQLDRLMVKLLSASG